jgi:ribosomal protein S19E (S16A)
MTEKITPAALAMLERLDRLWPNDAPPSVGRDIAQELASRGLVLDSSFGMQITDEGRKYLRVMHGSGFGLR